MRNPSGWPKNRRKRGPRTLGVLGEDIISNLGVLLTSTLLLRELLGLGVGVNLLSLLGVLVHDIWRWWQKNSVSVRANFSRRIKIQQLALNI
jgi:hypothetical protein